MEQIKNGAFFSSFETRLELNELTLNTFIKPI